MAQRVTAAKLETIARAAVAACEGGALTATALAGIAGRPWFVGAGKAVGAMAAGARRALAARFRAGPLIGKHAGPPGIEVRLCGHPLPDERGVRATHDLLSFLGQRDADEEVVLLLSGGASSLLAATVDGVSLDALRATTLALLRGGAAIGEINTVRRHLGRALGGRLALATPARLTVLALSDVVGDDPAAIGSGPASPDPTTIGDALAVARRFAVDDRVIALLDGGAIDETPKPGDPRLARVEHRLLATPLTLRDRAIDAVRAAGLAPLLGMVGAPPLVEGDVESVAAQLLARAPTLPPGAVQIAVGEPTVRVRGAGRGGRAQQLALLMARGLAGQPFAFCALASDGTDGPTDAAGARVDGATFPAALAQGLDPERAIAECDALPLFAAAGLLVRLGPTGTNLLDLHLLARIT